jgi:hypothetical protein
MINRVCAKPLDDFSAQRSNGGATLSGGSEMTFFWHFVATTAPYRDVASRKLGNDWKWLGKGDDT